MSTSKDTKALGFSLPTRVPDRKENDSFLTSMSVKQLDDFFTYQVHLVKAANNIAKKVDKNGHYLVTVPKEPLAIYLGSHFLDFCIVFSPYDRLEKYVTAGSNIPKSNTVAFCESFESRQDSEIKNAIDSLLHYREQCRNLSSVKTLTQEEIEEILQKLYSRRGTFQKRCVNASTEGEQNRMFHEIKRINEWAELLYRAALKALQRKGP